MFNIPTRPKMPSVSRELFNSTRYSASLTRAGVIVQRHATGTGKVLPVSHPQYQEWATAWDDIIDDAEGDLLCKALLS